MRRRVPAIVALVIASMVLLAGASTILYRHALADFFNDGGPACGGV